MSTADALAVFVGPACAHRSDIPRRPLAAGVVATWASCACRLRPWLCSAAALRCCSGGAAAWPACGAAHPARCKRLSHAAFRGCCVSEASLSSLADEPALQCSWSCAGGCACCQQRLSGPPTSAPALAGVSALCCSWELAVLPARRGRPVCQEYPLQSAAAAPAAVCCSWSGAACSTCIMLPASPVPRCCADRLPGVHCSWSGAGSWLCWRLPTAVHRWRLPTAVCCWRLPTAVHSSATTTPSESWPPESTTPWSLATALGSWLSGLSLDSQTPLESAQAGLGVLKAPDDTQHASDPELSPFWAGDSASAVQRAPEHCWEHTEPAVAAAAPASGDLGAVPHF